jgi:flavin prenyltransferase
MKLVVAIGGASGSVYAKRLLDTLVSAGPALAAGGDPLEVGLCFSNAGREVWHHEIGDEPTYPFARYGLQDFRAPFASGSAGWQAMVVIPCSTGGLARIAHGISDDLIGRAADVMIKERRKLVLVVRETPLSAIHLENMLAVTRAGAVVLPASPSFYSKPSDVGALVDTVVGRVLDQLGIAHTLRPRWGEPGGSQGARA